MKRLIAILLLCAGSMEAATVTHAIASPDSGNTPNTSGSFTPAANDLLIVLVAASGTLVASDAGSLTDSQGLGFTLVTSSNTSSPRSCYIFIANALAAASSMTVTFNCPGDPADGTLIMVALVSGMTRTGSSAIKQFKQGTQVSAGGTPAITFDASCDTNNPTLGIFANATNTAGVTEPTGWTEAVDSGYTNPITGGEYVYRDSGFTGTTITWGSTTASIGIGAIVELDTSSAGGSAIKTILGLPYASVKTVDDLAIASVKTWDGLQ